MAKSMAAKNALALISILALNLEAYAWATPRRGSRPLSQYPDFGKPHFYRGTLANRWLKLDDDTGPPKVSGGHGGWLAGSDTGNLVSGVDFGSNSVGSSGTPEIGSASEQGLELGQGSVLAPGLGLDSNVGFQTKEGAKLAVEMALKIKAQEEALEEQRDMEQMTDALSGGEMSQGFEEVESSPMGQPWSRPPQTPWSSYYSSALQDWKAQQAYQAQYGSGSKSWWPRKVAVVRPYNDGTWNNAHGLSYETARRLALAKKYGAAYYGQNLWNNNPSPVGNQDSSGVYQVRGTESHKKQYQKDTIKQFSQSGPNRSLDTQQVEDINNNDDSATELPTIPPTPAPLVPQPLWASAPGYYELSHGSANTLWNPPQIPVHLKLVIETKCLKDSEDEGSQRQVWNMEQNSQTGYSGVDEPASPPVWTPSGWKWNTGHIANGGYANAHDWSAIATKPIGTQSQWNVEQDSQAQEDAVPYSWEQGSSPSVWTPSGWKWNAGADSLSQSQLWNQQRWDSPVPVWSTHLAQPNLAASTVVEADLPEWQQAMLEELRRLEQSQTKTNWMQSQSQEHQLPSPSWGPIPNYPNVPPFRWQPKVPEWEVNGVKSGNEASAMGVEASVPLVPRSKSWVPQPKWQSTWAENHHSRQHQGRRAFASFGSVNGPKHWRKNAPKWR